jgi:hypothetical protein
MVNGDQHAERFLSEDQRNDETILGLHAKMTETVLLEARSSEWL